VNHSQKLQVRKNVNARPAENSGHKLWQSIG
jgi:hypothetical protein